MLQGKPKRFPPRLQNAFFTLTLPTVALCQPGPREFFCKQDWEPLGKRAIVSWEGVRLGGCGETRGFGIPRQPIPPGKTFLERGPFLSKSVSWMSRSIISECSQQRELCPPKGWLALRCVYWIPRPTPPTPPTALLRERPAPVEPGAALERGVFFVFCCFLYFPFSRFSISPCVPTVCPWPHSLTPGKPGLHMRPPAHLQPGRKGSRRGSPRGSAPGRVGSHGS